MKGRFTYEGWVAMTTVYLVIGVGVFSCGTIPGSVCAVIVGACSYGLLWPLRTYVVRPAFLRRRLRRQGFDVRAYRPIAGDLPELRRMEKTAQEADMPGGAHSQHHLLFARLFPYYHKRLTELRGDLPFVYWFGSQPTLVLTHPDDVKCALSADVRSFHKPSAAVVAFKELFGSGSLLLADGDQWHTQRHILRPAFFMDRLKEMTLDMASSALEMVKVWEKQVSEDGHVADIEVAKDLKSLTADILARTSFGSSYMEGKSVFEKQVQLLELLVQLRVLKGVIPGYSFLPTVGNCKCKELEKKITEGLSEIVEARRQTFSKRGGALRSSGSDLLGLILTAEEQEIKLGSISARFTADQVIDECKTFFFAGHETTSSLLAWTMLLLSLNQHWQDKARQEVLEVCGKEGKPSADQLNKLKIMGMILKETLRLYPPVPEYGRRTLHVAKGAFRLGQKALPKGIAITVSCLYIHRRKDIWGEDADEFRPERFTDGVAKACKHPHGFMPFGLGPRICLGQHFAFMEAKVIMAVILQHFRFTLSPQYRHAPIASVTIRPKHGVHVILEPLK